MTLGPTLILLAAAERPRGRIADAMARIGAAPMIFSGLHLLVLHIASYVVARATGAAGLYHFDRVEAVWVATVGFLAACFPLTPLLASRPDQHGSSIPCRTAPDPPSSR